MRKDGASAAALDFIGGRGSALQAVWHAAILKLRGVPLFPPKVYRLVGGNQRLTDTFAERLGARIRLSSPLTEIEHGDSGVRISCRAGDQTTRLEADYLVCAMSARMLRLLPVKPALPEDKSYAIANVPYYHDTRVILQSRTPFWTRDGVSPNMEFGEASLFHVWRASQEVKTTRGLLAGTASGAGTADRALATYRKFYPGRSENIEKAHVVVWALDPWASACERTSYAPGPAREVLAGAHRAARPHSFRRRVRGQSELGHGGGDAIRQSRRRSDSSGMTQDATLEVVSRPIAWLPPSGGSVRAQIVRGRNGDGRGDPDAPPRDWRRALRLPCRVRRRRAPARRQRN